MNTSAKARWRVFPYLPVDYKAAEDHLNAQAEAGWEVEQFALYGWLARYVRGNGQPRRYCVDLFDKAQSNDLDYLSLCREAGWNDVPSKSQGLVVYHSEPGVRPVPLQTDCGVEVERYERKYIRFSALAVVALLLPLLLLFPGLHLLTGSGLSLASAARSGLLRALSAWNGLLTLLMVLIVLVLSMWSLAAALLYRRRARRASAMPAGGQRAARARGWARLVCTLFYLLYLVGLMFDLLNLSPSSQDYGREDFGQLAGEPILLARDLGIDDSRTGNCTVERSGSPLIRYRFCLDPTGGGIRTFWYGCVTEGLAQWTAGTLMDSADLAWMDLGEFRPVELGFDESWTTRGGDALLLRQGNVAVLVVGWPDWTDPAVLDILWARLRLEG